MEFRKAFEDLFLIPDLCKQILLAEHHHVVHATFTDESRLQRFVKDLATHGIRLPRKLPDKTFKKPDWMGKS